MPQAKVEGRSAGEQFEFTASNGAIFHCTAPSEREKRSLLHIYATKGGYIAAETAMERHVFRVENYLNAGGKPIKDGIDAAEHSEAKIIGEVFNELLYSSSLTEETKNE